MVTLKTMLVKYKYDLENLLQQREDTLKTMLVKYKWRDETQKRLLKQL